MTSNKARARVPVRVVLVEDSAMIRDRLVEGIAAAGRVEVIGQAETETAAKSLLDGLECDVVVLDLDLKQGNGLQVLKWLRSTHSDHRPVVIIFTNYVLPHYRSQSMRMGADYFFDKARDFDRVREVIEGFAPSGGDPA